MDIYIGSKLLNTNDSSVSKIALDSLNWILGTNPLCKSFVTGYGDRAVKNIYSSIYSFDGKKMCQKDLCQEGPIWKMWQVYPDLPQSLTLRIVATR
jgi:hypothetical protein